MKPKIISRIFCLYALILLFLFFISVIVLVHALNDRQATVPSESEVIYVYLSESITQSAVSETELKETWWTVKEYNGQIGVFNADGSLLEILETYVKTLPAADQALLREGITVYSKKELFSVIADYTT